MLRSSLRPYFAVFLLLCLVRTLLPEAWVLALHAHEHTTEKPGFAAQRVVVAGKRQALLTPKHTHCHGESFYHVPFQAAPPVVVPQPRVQLRYESLGAPTELASSATASRCAALRGPPASQV